MPSAKGLPGARAKLYVVANAGCAVIATAAIAAAASVVRMDICSYPKSGGLPTGTD
jgi:hypothetical protein